MTIIQPPGGSTFNFVFPGEREWGFPILYLLFGEQGDQIAEIIRYRTGWVELGDAPCVALYTRVGGPNREPTIEAIMRIHETFASYTDDTFDDTYATVRFGIPHGFNIDSFIVDAHKVQDEVGIGRLLVFDHPRDMDEEWRSRLDAFEAGVMTSAQEAAMMAFGDQLQASFAVDPELGVHIGPDVVIPPFDEGPPVTGDPKTDATIAARHAVVVGWCQARGITNADDLTFEQIMEIRDLPEWKDAGRG